MGTGSSYASNLFQYAAAARVRRDNNESRCELELVISTMDNVDLVQGIAKASAPKLFCKFSFLVARALIFIRAPLIPIPSHRRVFIRFICSHTKVLLYLTSYPSLPYPKNPQKNQQKHFDSDSSRQRPRHQFGFIKSGFMGFIKSGERPCPGPGWLSQRPRV